MFSVICVIAVVMLILRGFNFFFCGGHKGYR